MIQDAVDATACMLRWRNWYVAEMDADVRRDPALLPQLPVSAGQSEVALFVPFEQTLVIVTAHAVTLIGHSMP